MKKQTHSQILKNKFSLENFSFLDVIDPDSCWRLYWQQVVTHENIDLDVEVIEDPDNKHFCFHYAKKPFELLFQVPI